MIPSYLSVGFMTTCMSPDLREMLGDQVDAFAGINQFPNSLTQTDTSFGFGATSNLTGECPPVFCARGRPQLVDCCDDAASRC